MAVNSFKTQTAIKKAIAFQWKAFEGFADRLTFRNDELPAAVENTGKSVKLRRPSRYNATNVGVGNDYSLGTTVASLQPFTYKAMTEDVVDFTVNARFEQNLQVSMEDLMFNLDKQDVMERHITPAITGMRNAINAYIARYVEAYTGATIVTDGSADGIIKGLFDAKALLESRGGVADGDDRVVLFNKKVMPTLALGSAKIFKASGAEKTYAKGLYEPIAGFDLYESPVLSAPTIAALGSSVVVTAISAQDVWSQTFTITVDGLTAQTIKAGTKVKFLYDGTNPINWLVPNTDIDAGYVATFTVVADVAVDGTGDVLTLSEPLISSGDKANVTQAVVPATTKIALATSTGLVRPSYAFGKNSVVLGSPKVKIPSGVAYGENLKFGGLNVALIEEHWPGTYQNIVKLVCFLAVAVPQPEAILALY